MLNKDTILKELELLIDKLENDNNPDLLRIITNTYAYMTEYK